MNTEINAYGEINVILIQATMSKWVYFVVGTKNMDFFSVTSLVLFERKII